MALVRSCTAPRKPWPVSWEKTRRAAASDRAYCAEVEDHLDRAALGAEVVHQHGDGVRGSSRANGPVATSATAKVVDIVTLEASSSPRETGIGPSSPRIRPTTSSQPAAGTWSTKRPHVQAVQRQGGDCDASPSDPGHEQAEAGGDGRSTLRVPLGHAGVQTHL